MRRLKFSTAAFEVRPVNTEHEFLSETFDNRHIFAWLLKHFKDRSIHCESVEREERLESRLFANVPRQIGNRSSGNSRSLNSKRPYMQV